MRSNDINPIFPQINPDSVPPVPVHPKKTSIIPINIVIGIVVGVILTASTASAFYFYQASKKLVEKNKTDSITQIPTNTPSPITVEPSSPYKITWLKQPQKISSLEIFNQTKQSQDEPEIYFNESRYYLIANLGDGSQLIKLLLPIEGMIKYDSVYRIIKSTDGQLSILDSDNIVQIKKYLSDKVTISSISFKELTPPEIINSNNSLFSVSYESDKAFDKLVNPILLSSTDYGDFYMVYTPREDIEGVNGIYTKSFYLRLKDWTLFNYNQKYEFLSDSKTVWFKWSDGSSTNDDQFYSIVHFGGCGGGVNGSDIIKNDSYLIKDKVMVASDSYNKSIYQIKDINNVFLKELYKSYKSTSENITPAAVPNIEEFANQKNHFLYQDFSGDWVIFVNQKYAMQAECGKPVIYLYPQKETKVDVKVGAQITKSEPTYPQNGWTVTAKPNGELTYQNQTYPYLFWEGLGNGVYPNYKNRGTVVAQKDLVFTVYKQLSQLGLNQKESADFMEFWQSRLPTTPYVRLTWLNTADMDTLAPLFINPVPNTKIRIFLEFEGLNEKIKLIPQTLSAPKRNGFTLIEWGGLLLNK